MYKRQASANHRALTAEIRKAKQIANGAGMVAINAMVATQDYAAAIRTAVEAGVDAVVSGAGLPLELPGLVNTLSLIHIYRFHRTCKTRRQISKCWLFMLKPRDGI